MMIPGLGKVSAPPGGPQSQAMALQKLINPPGLQPGAGSTSKPIRPRVPTEEDYELEAEKQDVMDQISQKAAALALKVEIENKLKGVKMPQSEVEAMASETDKKFTDAVKMARLMRAEIQVEKDEVERLNTQKNLKLRHPIVIYVNFKKPKLNLMVEASAGPVPRKHKGFDYQEELKVMRRFNPQKRMQYDMEREKQIDKQIKILSKMVKNNMHKTTTISAVQAKGKAQTEEAGEEESM